MKYLFQNYPGSSVEELERLSPDEEQAIRDEHETARCCPRTARSSTRRSTWADTS
jgi:hypothetical protein